MPNQDKIDEINPLEYLQVVVRNKLLVAVTVLMVTAATAGFMFFQPNEYTSTATLLPVEKTTSVGISSLLGSMGGGLGALAMQAGLGAGDKFVTILETRTISESVITRLNLKDYFQTQRRSAKQMTMLEAVAALKEHTKIERDKRRGFISVSFTALEPQLAAEVANAYVAELQRYLQANALSTAKRNRLFVEEQLKKARQDMAVYEVSLKDFQQQNKVVSLDAQADAAVRTYANLKAKQMASEIELGLLERGSLEGDPHVVLKRQEVGELKKQLNDFENGSTGPLVSFNQAPSIGLSHARIKRELLVREKVVEFLTQQSEMAKIQEAQEDISFQVLDPAIPPEKKTGPKRTLNTLIAFGASAFLGIFFAFMAEFWVRTRTAGKSVLSV